jgi:hypothetical protein
MEADGFSGSIVDLPEDVLYLILDLCRPDGFESAMLACTRFYFAGRPLIRKHEMYKKYASDPILNITPNGRLVIHDMNDFLGYISSVPAKHQLEVLRYFKDLVFFSNDFHTLLCNKSTTVDFWKRCPDVYEALCEIAQQLTNGEPYADIQEYLSIYTDADWDLSRIQNFFPAEASVLEALMLPLFSQARSIVFVDGPKWLGNSSSALPVLITKLHGTSFLKNLDELFVKNMRQYECCKLELLIASLLSLKTLAIEGLSWEDDDHGSVDSFAAASHKESASKLGRLAIYYGSWRAEQMGVLLQRLPALKTLVFCEDHGDIETNLPSDFEEFLAEVDSEEDITPSDLQPPDSPTLDLQPPDLRTPDLPAPHPAYMGDQEFLNYCFEPILEYVSGQGEHSIIPFGKEDTATHAKDVVISDGEDSYSDSAFVFVGERAWLDIDCVTHPSRLFQPSVILDQILCTHGNSLKRLAIMGYSKFHTLAIETRFKIQHFRDFKQLTHLDINAQVLASQGRGGATIYPPLTDILPSSVEAVSLILDYPYIEAAILLLASLPSSISRFPSLRRILLRVEDDEKNHREIRLGLHEQVFRKFKRDFAKVGIDFESREEKVNRFGLAATFPRLRPRGPDIVWESENDPALEYNLFESFADRHL